MWIMLTKGAVSIVKFNHAPEGDPRTMQVRSRREEWIRAFAQYMDHPRKIEFIHSDDKDYQWRFFATPEDVSAAVGRAVLDIKYSNFKNATTDPKFGLRKAALRHSLHSAYNKVWSDILQAGDGTSCFDPGNWSKKYNSASMAGAGTIAICVRLGHFWTKDEKKCQDCGLPNPRYPKPGVFAKPTKAQVEDWWAEHPDVPRPGTKVTKTAKQASAKAAEPEGEWTVQCPGAYTHAVKGSLETKGNVATGECIFCRQRYPLTLDSWLITKHAKPEPDVTDEVDAIVAADLPVESDLRSLTFEQLAARRDAAQDHYYDVEEQYQRFEAAMEDLEAALDAYTEVDDVYQEALRQQEIRESA